MNWVEFEGVTFNLDRVTHFEITEQEDVSEIRAFLNVAHPALQLLDKQDVMGHKLEFQVSIKVAKGTKTVCQNLLKKIIAGEYNLPCKGHLYPIREHLNQMNINLEKISENVELLAQKQ